MAHRIEVQFDDAEFAVIRRAAERQRVSVSALVRAAVRTCVHPDVREAQADRLSVIERAVAHSYPTADIEQMLRETEAGLLGESVR